jgi:hypothetical protein
MAVWNSQVEIIIFLDVNDLHARFIQTIYAFLKTKYTSHCFRLHYEWNRIVRIE